MKTTSNLPLKRTLAGLAAAAVLGAWPAARAGLLTPATEPLGTGTSTILPNVMFILDDSGSMGWDFMPDYVNDSHSSTAPSSTSSSSPSTAGCFDSGDDNDPSTGSIKGRPDTCRVGDPPYMSPDFNTIYYNPAIYYKPALNYDGTSMPSQNRANTTSWTSVRTDMFNVSNRDQLGNGVNNVNLASDYPDRIWCKNQSDPASSCVQNSAYTYPSFLYPYGEDTGGDLRYVSSTPYYYRFASARWCSDAALTNCKSGSDIDPLVHVYPAIEYCTDVELTSRTGSSAYDNCAVGSAVTSAHKYYGVRWCSDAGTLQDCQRKKLAVKQLDGTYKHYIYAKHLGTTKDVTGTFPATKNVGSITVTNVDAGGGTINSIRIGGVDVIALAIPVASGLTPSAVASLIATAINAHASSPDYDAIAEGPVVLVGQTVAGAAGTGAAIVLNAATGSMTSAQGSVTVDTSSRDRTRTISVVSSGGTNLLCAPVTGDTTNFDNNVSVQSDGSIRADPGWNNKSEVDSVVKAIAGRINRCAVDGYSATYTLTSTSVSRGTVTIIAPASGGASYNGRVVDVTGDNLTGISTSNLAGGAGFPSVAASTTAMLGGADAYTGTRTYRVGVGGFQRTDITALVDSYPKAAGRTDCLSTTCSYDDEMTNFANWYAYYRTRINMMKTAAGHAFRPVDDSFRVGFITINPGDTVSATKYLKVSEFAATAGGHKEAWYTKFYSQSAASSTPLREALARVGWLFAGKFNTGLTKGIGSADDPITMSCQPNFAILSTDGYWNGNAGQKPDATAIGNQDNVDGGYSTRKAGAYDGNVLPTTSAGSSAGGSDTLADVAMYYYKNDLRTSMNNNVPVTNKDSASHQHMVTFTLGLGLDGEMTYTADYETATTGDFAALKSGTRDWPSPKENAPSALDDLWHAAVNGRGVFFSARDPATLTSSLVDTLAALRTRVGAGAAAATSNLQPVAGDNFAFTAQYQTNDWIGDLKARTIDLSSGILSSVVLWSAADVLKGTEHFNRTIYTFDPTDAAGNGLKHFCWPGSGGSWCSDGAGLDATEQAFFKPDQLNQYVLYGATGSPRRDLADSQGAQLLVNYLRGDTDYEDSGASLNSDLFRRRLSLLGDIVNAQPAYVRASPFGYGDPGYSGYKACTQGTGTGCPAGLSGTTPRRGTVFAAANDGMLHAFETDVNNNPYYQTGGIITDVTSDDTFTGNNAGNGVERWAYIPRIVMPELYRLANSNPVKHRYYTDGSPQVGDVCISTPCAGVSDWRTILVAGLNSGGSGYYALDITNPVAPRGLWELTNAGTCWSDAAIDAGDKTSDCHLGLSYGNPLITKRPSDGKWVVLVTSGYNNNVGGGDGRGYLYMIEAYTGKILKRMTTGVGTSGAPSGLARINGYASNGSVDNTTLTVYGGDLEGNMWRFNLDPALPKQYQAVLLATAMDGAATPIAQPITTRPELGQTRTGKRVVVFGTGKFIELSDKDTAGAQKQTIYALRDEPTALPVAPATAMIPDVRGTSIKVRQFANYTANDTTRDIAPGDRPDWAVDWGWRIDLPETGERVNVDPQLQLGTLVVPSNVPSGDSCTAGGTGWINYIDLESGSNVGEFAAERVPSSLIVGINVIMLPGGAVETIVTTADNKQLSKDTPITPSSFSGRRTSWRELFLE